jgi:hypothetical protein
MKKNKKENQNEKEKKRMRTRRKWKEIGEGRAIAKRQEPGSRRSEVGKAGCENDRTNCKQILVNKISGQAQETESFLFFSFRTLLSFSKS